MKKPKYANPSDYPDAKCGFCRVNCGRAFLNLYNYGEVQGVVVGCGNFISNVKKEHKYSQLDVFSLFSSNVKKEYKTPQLVVLLENCFIF